MIFWWASWLVIWLVLQGVVSNIYFLDLQVTDGTVVLADGIDDLLNMDSDTLPSGLPPAENSRLPRCVQDPSCGREGMCRT